MASSGAGGIHTDDVAAAVGGAANLLVKALRRLEQGDEAGALPLVHRAVSMSAGEDRLVVPADVAVGALLREELERLRAADPAGWLDRVLAEVDPGGSTGTLLVLDLVARLGTLPRADQRRIRVARERVPFGDPLARDPGPGGRADVVLGLLRSIARLRSS